MNPTLWLERAARLWPKRPALMRGADLVHDYAGFAHTAACFGGALAEMGVNKGDRVAVFAANCCEYLPALYGVWHTGAAVVPINAKLHAKEVAWIVENAQASHVVASEKLARELKRQSDCPIIQIEQLPQSDPLAPQRMHGEDPVWLFYTSGTTGRPKGVVMASRNIVAMTMCYFVDVDEVSAEDAILYAAPMSHGAGLYNFMHLMRGARHVVPTSGGFDAQEIIDLAPKLKNVSMFAAPTMVKRLVEAASLCGYKGEGIKTLVYGGGPMYLADIQAALARFGPRFVQIYGQGECPMGITALSREVIGESDHPKWKQRLQSVGRAQSMVEVAILDDENQPMEQGEIGEICVRGQTVMPGYWNNPQASAATICAGWLRTGDRGSMDEDGFVTLRDRSKDVIVSGGTNIYPREIEDALLLHPAVKEVAVIGRPHSDWGESVVAVVVTETVDGADAAALDKHCIENIARFKRPKDYVFVDSLPKNNYGKVLKTNLRERYG